MDVAEIHVYTKSDTEDSVLQFKIGVKAASANHSYILKSATGLDPDEIMSQYYGRSGGTLTKYFKATMKERIVTLLLRLNPQYHVNETPESLRKQIYKSLSYGLTTELQLKFVDILGAEIASLNGFMTKVEAGLFSNESQMQLTFKCKNPFFEKSTWEVAFSGFTGLTYSWTDAVSDAPHGFGLVLKLASSGGPLTINNVTPFGTAPFYINYDFLANDVLYMQSIDGVKSIFIERPGLGEVNLANYVDPLSIWPTMYPGVSTLTFNIAAAVPSYIVYKHTFWGV